MSVPLKPQHKTTPPIDKYEERREYDREDDCKDTGLSDEKNTEEEASSRHEGESSSLDSSDSDVNDDDNEDTGANDNT